MATINLSPFDKKDLLEILDYSAEQYENNRRTNCTRQDHWDDTNWYLMRIEQLKSIINGYDGDIVYKSNLPTNDFIEKEEERKFVRYQYGEKRSKENE